MRSLRLALLALVTAAPAERAVYRESVEAGAVPILAEEVAIDQSLELLQGSIAYSLDSDLFRFQIHQPLEFSARLTDSQGTSPPLQLFLFDAWGRGIVASRGSFGSPPPQIPAATLRGWPASQYLLGIAPLGSEPLDSLGLPIFPVSSTGLSEPIGIARFSPLFKWNYSLNAIGGDYAITLTGASGTLAANLPGDFNRDGIVDAADYTVWRNGLAVGSFTLDHYREWKLNFGATSPGHGTGGNTSLAPEPASSVSLLLAAFAPIISRIATPQPARRARSQQISEDRRSVT